MNFGKIIGTSAALKRMLRQVGAVSVSLGERFHLGRGVPPRGQIPLTQTTFDLGVPNHDETPRLPVAAIRRASGGAQNGLDRFVRHGLVAEMTNGSLTRDGVE